MAALNLDQINVNPTMFSQFQNFRKFIFFCSFLEWGNCISGPPDYRYKEANILQSGTVGRVHDCASACSLNPSCVYWTYEETSQVCRLLPSGVLDMTQEIARTGKIRRGNRYCHSQFCLKPTFERGWVMAESEDSTKTVYYPKNKLK